MKKRPYFVVLAMAALLASVASCRCWGSPQERRAETPADYRACQEAQRLAWALADESYVVPVAMSRKSVASQRRRAFSS